MYFLIVFVRFCFFKQKTAYEMRISDWSSDVCSSDLRPAPCAGARRCRRRCSRRRCSAAATRAFRTRRRRRHRCARGCRGRARAAGPPSSPNGPRRSPACRTRRARPSPAARERASCRQGRRWRRRTRMRRRSEEHTSELQSLMRISYAVFCLKNKNKQKLYHLQKCTNQTCEDTCQLNHYNQRITSHIELHPIHYVIQKQS